MHVRDIMRSAMVTVPVTADLRTASQKLVEARVGTVTVVHEGQPVGLLTEQAIIKAGYLSNRPFSAIPVRKVMTQSFSSVPPGMPVRIAIKRMRRHGATALPVAEELEIVGSLTLKDISRNYSKLLKQATTETTELEETWNSEDLRIEFDN